MLILGFAEGMLLVVFNVPPTRACNSSGVRCMVGFGFGAHYSRIHKMGLARQLLRLWTMIIKSQRDSGSFLDRWESGRR